MPNCRRTCTARASATTDTIVSATITVSASVGAGLHAGPTAGRRAPGRASPPLTRTCRPTTTLIRFRVTSSPSEADAEQARARATADEHGKRERHHGCSFRACAPALGEQAEDARTPPMIRTTWSRTSRLRFSHSTVAKRAGLDGRQPRRGGWAGPSQAPSADGARAPRPRPAARARAPSASTERLLAGDVDGEHEEDGDQAGADAQLDDRHLGRAEPEHHQRGERRRARQPQRRRSAGAGPERPGAHTPSIAATISRSNMDESLDGEWVYPSTPPVPRRGRAAHVVQGLREPRLPEWGLVDMRQRVPAAHTATDEDQAGSRQKDERVNAANAPTTALR